MIRARGARIARSPSARIAAVAAVAAVAVGAVVFALAGLGASGRSQAAPFQDSIGQRVLACTGCHGSQGRAAADGYYPRIAGKPAGYLFNQLRAFQDGRRHYALMTGLLAPLDDAYLREIAEHFAAQDPPYPPPLPASESTALRDAGEALVRRGDPARGLPACIACHGQAMTGRQPFIPGLLGLPRDYLNAQLGAWQGGKRRASSPDCMAEVARRLRPEEIGALSAWLAAQPVPTHPMAPTAETSPLPIACGGEVAGFTMGSTRAAPPATRPATR